MPQPSTYAPGTPSWVDIGTDIEGAKAFYGGLFGWTAADAEPVEETGGYGFFFKDGLMVAGYGPQQSPGPPFWSTYVSVADADATAQAVERAGGTVILPPMAVMTAGRMGVFQDPQGAFVSVWEPGDHTGAQVVNEPGAFCWNELQARDVDRAAAFYGDVFGWAPNTHADGPMPYTEFELGGKAIGGMMPMPPMVPATVPSYWLVYFAVEDADASVSTAQSLGATVLMAPMTLPVGRFSVLADPQGATFAVIQLAG